MEILTLLKANIRHRKGAFTSIILLMLLISMAMTAMLSVRDNCTQSIENAYEQVDAGDLVICIRSRDLTDALFRSLEEHPLVESITEYDGICSDKAEIGENTTGTSWSLLKLSEEYRIFNSSMTGYEEETPVLKSGEIYVPQGVMTSMDCQVGDKVKIYTIGGEYEFRIRGIIVEPVYGSSTIGWKQVFISDDDFYQIYADSKAAETERITADVVILSVDKSPDCGLTDSQFKRQLNLDTGIVDMSVFSLTREISMHYTNLFPEIILSILMVFVGLLFVIVLIVMGHSISTSIEMDYVNLGILKSQGFSQNAIRSVFAMQYLLAELAGAMIGMLFAVPLTQSLGNVFQPITAVLAECRISVLKSLFIILVFLLVSALFIYVITRRIGKISPIRAISGGRSEIYFDSRMKLPVCGKGLSVSLALRQFTSGKRRYTGTVVIVSILVFFMMTIMVLGNVVNSKSAIESMSGIYTECDISFQEYPDDQILEEIEKTVEQYSAIEKKYYMASTYFSVNGEELYCLIYQNPDAIQPIKGRAPLYDNEIVITEILAEELELKMGDTVTVSNNDKRSEYIITGIFQSINDTGRCFGMGLEGAKRIGANGIYYAGYSLSDTSKSGEIADALNSRFPNILKAENVSDEGIGEIYTIAINAMKAVIYLFSVVFALIVVMMVCTKMFLQEKTDIGIYKALGFTSLHLRFQFAVRFLIVAAIGSVFGALLCQMFSGRLLGCLLKSIGITSFAVRYTPWTFLAPIAMICICFFLFAFLVSGKIKKVEIRELIAE